MYWILNLVAALAYVIGGTFMKLSNGLTRPAASLMVFLCFCIGAGLQAVAMQKAEMGVAYILVLGLEAVLAFGVGILFFREPFSFTKLLGAGLVVAGILMLHIPHKESNTTKDSADAPLAHTALDDRAK